MGARRLAERVCIAGRIAAHICNENGEPIFTEEDILGTASEERGALDGPIVIALLAVIQEVNELGKTTNSQERTSSGVS